MTNEKTIQMADASTCNLYGNAPKIISIDELLNKPLVIPDYQRPYKWTVKNIMELLLDIKNSIDERVKYATFKYRVGTVILCKNAKNEYEIVDGQQRTLSLLLLKLYLHPDFDCSLLGQQFPNKDTQRNLHDNYRAICEWFASNKGEKEQFGIALKDVLEVVMITVGKIDEAFQLFDSQNTRGKALYPHDLLKAYHLREIRDKYDMQNAVMKWESKVPESIRELFDLYLFPIQNWARCRKSGKFTASEIDRYKGIAAGFDYTYARRASKAMPYFLLTEPIVSGSDFFEMVDHYMLMLHNVKEEIATSEEFAPIRKMLTASSFKDNESGRGSVLSVEELDKAMKSHSAGLNYARNLFFCALLCYYDRFHNFDVLAVKKLFTWAMMIRVDMQHLGFDTINRYAMGLEGQYSNSLPVISIIANARLHTEISSMKVNIAGASDADSDWNKLSERLFELYII